MINEALQFTSDMLDQFLKNRFGLDTRIVSLNNLIEANGSIPQGNQNKLVVSLINIEKETAKPFHVRHHRNQNGSFTDINSAGKYNLDILISSNFDDYRETLKFLNAVIVFFQNHSVLDADFSSNIPAGISRLDFEIEKLTYQQMQSLWTAMGAKYQPSVIYKMKLLTIQGNETAGFTPEVSNISIQAQV